MLKMRSLVSENLQILIMTELESKMKIRWNLVKDLMPKMGRVEPPSDNEVVFVK